MSVTKIHIELFALGRINLRGSLGRVVWDLGTNGIRNPIEPLEAMNFWIPCSLSYENVNLL